MFIGDIVYRKRDNENIVEKSVYINKDYDKITTVIEPTENGGSQYQRSIGEVKQYLDMYHHIKTCRRIFKFSIHERQPTLERLYFYLPREQLIYFIDLEDIDNILSRSIILDSMFTSRMEANKKYEEWGNLC
ncbi:hypothetical protein Lal_00023924 [Lupinus albus]|nr:hypothetical protein Lal_00023924 [Lupinus albus]